MKDKFSKFFWISLIMVNLGICILVLFFEKTEKDYSVNQKEHSYLIGVSYMTMNNEFYKIISEEISARVEAEGDRLVLRDPALDADRQNSQILEMLDMGINVLIVTPVEWESLADVLKKAKEQGVLTVVVDTRVSDSRLHRINHFKIRLCPKYDLQALSYQLLVTREGKIQCIVVKDMSRFGRDYLEVGNYISRVFPFLGIRFIAVNDGYDSIRPADPDSLETSFKTLLYDLYSRDLSKKVRSAKKRKAENGEFLSPFAPYGYVKDTERKNHLIIDEEAAGNVRRIFQMAADGQTTGQIARELNIEHVPTPMKQKRREGCRREWKSICGDNFWTRNAVGVILRDERYIGTNIYGKRVRDEVGKSHTVKNRREDWTAVENAHEGIVSRSEFERAQEAMRKFTEHPCSPSGRPFNKKIRCGICGHIMARIGRKNPYYICRTPEVTDMYACPAERMPEKDFMDVLAAQLRVQALYAVNISRIWEEKHRKEKQDVKSIQKSISILRETHAALERHIREIYEKNIFGEIDKETYLKEKNASAKKRDSIRAEIDALEARLQKARADGKLENRFVDSFSKYTEIDELTADIVSDVLQEIVVYPGGRFQVVWNYGDELERLLLDINMEDKAENAED